MQTGSSETFIGWKSGKTTYVPHGTEWRERGYGLWQTNKKYLVSKENQQASSG
jgi:hypothetical protein